MNGAETLPGEVKTDSKVDTVVMMNVLERLVRAPFGQPVLCVVRLPLNRQPRRSATARRRIASGDRILSQMHSSEAGVTDATAAAVPTRATGR
jgi:hypothetical protein